MSELCPPSQFPARTASPMVISDAKKTLESPCILLAHSVVGRGERCCLIHCRIREEAAAPSEAFTSSILAPEPDGIVMTPTKTNPASSVLLYE